MREWAVVEGESFTDADVRTAATVCLIGQTVAENVFRTESPVGKRVRLKGLQFRIVGEGPQGSRLRALHDRLGLGEAVVFLGHVDRDTLALEYSRARCFCLPTVQESFGLVFAEAMAAGLPVVACRAAAVPEVVRDGETGLLVPPRTPTAIAAALERMLGDDGMRKEMGMAGRMGVEALDLVPVAQRFLEALPA